MPSSLWRLLWVISRCMNEPRPSCYADWVSPQQQLKLEQFEQSNSCWLSLSLSPHWKLFQQLRANCMLCTNAQAGRQMEIGNWQLAQVKTKLWQLASTSLCSISLFSRCWNIAYGGDPLCWDWGAHAKIAVLMPRLWCSCQDCGAHAKIAVLMMRLRCSIHLNLGLSTAISAWAPQTRHEHLNPSTATTSPKVTAYFRGIKWNFEPKPFFCS